MKVEIFDGKGDQSVNESYTDMRQQDNSENIKIVNKIVTEDYLN